jgi:hypothetical protein
MESDYKTGFKNKTRSRRLLVGIIVAVAVIIFGILYLNVLMGQNYPARERSPVNNPLLPADYVADPFPKLPAAYVPSAALLARANYKDGFISNPEKTVAVAFYVNDPERFNQAMIELQTLQASRTALMATQVRSIQEDIFNFTPYLSNPQSLADIIKKDELPKTQALLTAVLSEIDSYVVRLQLQYKYLRPALVQPNLAPTVEVSNSPSFPNDVAAKLYVVAEFMGKLEPESKNAFVAVADAVSFNMSRVGLNYVRDSSAAKEIVAKYFMSLDNDMRFTQSFALVLDEWNQYRLQSVTNQDTESIP